MGLFDLFKTKNMDVTEEERKCNKCKKNYDYVLVGIAIDKNLIYLCDTCLQDLNRNIVDYFSS